jgi:hypothetical protein
MNNLAIQFPPIFWVTSIFQMFSSVEQGQTHPNHQRNPYFSPIPCHWQISVCGVSPHSRVLALRGKIKFPPFLSFLAPFLLLLIWPLKNFFSTQFPVKMPSEISLTISTLAQKTRQSWRTISYSFFIHFFFFCFSVFWSNSSGQRSVEFFGRVETPESSVFHP